ncbi:MAG: ATP-binding cassette domain-containing protein [Bacteroidetes bacterium]|nr:ATP-binding cassette domain-containing protein [Bacteroidota bacterium]
MSEKILKALMQLFAILAKVDFTDKNHEIHIPQIVGKDVVESILRNELSTTSVDFYLDYYIEQVRTLHKPSSKKHGLEKRTSVNSVKILRVCSQINKELTQNQKLIVLVRVLEYIRTNGDITNQELDFTNTVAETFNVSLSILENLKKFILQNDIEELDEEVFLHVQNRPITLKRAKSIQLNNLDERMVFFRIASENLLFVRYFGKEELVFNGQGTNPSRIIPFSTGCALRTIKSSTLYYSDVFAGFIQDQISQKISFEVKDLKYQFEGGRKGIHHLNLSAESGNLFGIMGGSGTGKSTLLNILNGTITPTSGSIIINGINLTSEPDELDGIIGHISQDDLLIEELTVFQNLYFNAKLCFADLKKLELKRKVVKVLEDVGLLHVRNLKVGNPIAKTISGGQRKRLNIALELIREPSVLFVDEPTSGLSSRDSENIMSLLKQLTFKGKLIFVVIHQPSSDIYKMFDRMLILDQGGYPVYDGNPIDAIVHFKTHAEHVNAGDRECNFCGNVNPELLFNIIESKIIDEFGHVTPSRKVQPKEWHSIYESSLDDFEEIKHVEPLKRTYKKPGTRRQLNVYFVRDFLSKISNKQYILINMLEAPILAFILAFFLKYYDVSNTGSTELTYSLYHNENIPQYLFIGVIVALFLGLTVAAEEIIKDRHLLKRERFLGLSKASYLLSKISIMFLISGIQTLLFVLVGNYLMEIEGLLFQHWYILFTAACFSNLLGLIISSTFNSAKVIYIVVPLLIIPQLLFSGVIVKFDKLNPLFSSQKSVPWIGNIMTSRWIYEAMVVSTKNMSIEQDELYVWNQTKVESGWKRDYWIPELLNQIEILKNRDFNRDLKERAVQILNNEIGKETNIWSNFKCESCEIQSTKDLKPLKKIEEYLETIRKQYQLQFEESTDLIDQEIRGIGDKEFAKKVRFSNDRERAD